MEKAYESKLHDLKWQDFWKAHNLASPEIAVSKHPNPTGKSYTIVMPPPNVTGVLHQGHALTMALEDTLVRWRRMKGDETLYLPGTDHAAIAVQMQVVKKLEAEGIDYHAIGREKFLESCWQWIQKFQPRIYKQIAAIGTSCDWSRVKFTLDAELNHAVKEAFVMLFEKGLIYRDEQLVNWTPKGQTGLSDLEVGYEERQGKLWYLRYPIEGEKEEYIVVATTRPETMLGDSGVAVHPDDDRYKKLHGKFVRLPISGRLVPVIADDFVDKEFGTGVVKITPAHDPNDFECGKRHGLERINILTKTGSIVAGLPGGAADLAGLDRFVARKKVVQFFEENNLLAKIENHTNRVGVSERFGDVVEPYLSHQWFVKIEDMARDAAKLVSDGEIKIVPHEFHNQYMRWMENIHDWCISRQLWWGHAIPAFHCQSCSHIEVSRERPMECAKCHSKEIVDDPDVLDTWFSSALWPFSTLGWPNVEASDFKKFYPTQVLETGFDILFFWVARMIMFGKAFTGKAPFDRVYMHPMVRDAQGFKMSKTKGNVIDPIELIEKYGADTLRFSLSALCVQGRELNLSVERIEGYRNFINKVWNAVRFVLMGLTSDAKIPHSRPKAKGLHDRWILTRLDQVSRDVDLSWSEFRMQEACDTLYHFVWNDFCDWYLECSKVSREESSHVLLYTMDQILKLLHPVIPHVSEELWHQLPGVSDEDSLMVSPFPEGVAFPDADALAEFRFFQDVVSSIRNIRSQNSVRNSQAIKVAILCSDAASEKLLKEQMLLLCSLAKINGSVSFEEAQFEQAAKGVVASLTAGKNVEIQVELGGLVNKASEIERINKEIVGVQNYVGSLTKKLSNKGFVDRAPPEVVEKERIKLKEAQDRERKLLQSLEALKG